jgi:hypothetical protein
MAGVTTDKNWGRRLSSLALVLAVGGLAAVLLASAGTAAEAWTFRTGFVILRYAFYAAVAGGVLSLIALVVARRDGPRTRRKNVAALLIAAGFVAYLGMHIVTAKRVPAIHDVTTDLADPPQLVTLPLRADNLENIPDNGDAKLAALDPESRWKALHRAGYGDLRGARIALSPAAAFARAEALVARRGWDVASINPRTGTIEATDTSQFFRFKDDVVIRVRPDPTRAGGSIVDLRSISRVGGSDIGVNAKRIRAFLADLAA